jgi:membrane protein
MRFREIPSLLKQTFTEWVDDKTPRLGAALSFYTIFSLAPLLVIAVAIAGLAFGQQAAQERVFNEIKSQAGEQAANLVLGMIQSASRPSSTILAAIIGIGTLLLGATGVFVELHDALNTIWEIRLRPGRPLWGLVKDRLFSFLAVMGIGFLLLLTLAVSAALTAMGSFLKQATPGLALTGYLLQGANFVLSLAVVTVLFGLIFKVLPDVRIAWKDTLVGAFVTAALFTMGKILIAFYLGTSTVASVYGAAGSLAIVLLWIYYSAQIFFLGAEFTQVYARRFGSEIVPVAGAERVLREIHHEGREAHPVAHPVSAPRLQGLRADGPARPVRRERLALFTLFLGMLLGLSQARNRSRGF